MYEELNISDMLLLGDKLSVIKAHERSLIGQWIASKSAKDHLLVFCEKFNINQSRRDYPRFMEQFSTIKRSHVDIMAKVCSYLYFKEILTLTKVNRRLYFVTGDMPLLRTFTRHETEDKYLLEVPQR